MSGEAATPVSKSSTATAKSGSDVAHLSGVLARWGLIGNVTGAALFFGLGSAIYWLCLRFLFPGYFAPLTPDHSDLYMAVGFLERSFTEVLTYPRPLTYAFLRTSGLLGVQGSILVVTLVAIAGTLLVAAMTARWAGCRMSWLGVACYLVLVFGHPEFYFEHRHDSPAVISLALAVLAAECWRRWLVGGRWQAVAGCYALTFALGLVKENYYPSLLILLAMLAVVERQWQWKRVIPAVAGVCALLVIAFLISAAGFRRWMPAGAESYHISLAPAEIWKGFVFYVIHLFTWVSAAALLTALAMTLRNRRRLLVAGGMAAAGIASLAPNSLLPNHLFEEYAWLAVPFCFAPLLLTGAMEPAGSDVGVPGSQARFRMLAQGGLLALTALSVWSYLPRYGSETHRWSITQEMENRAIMRSFGQLRKIPAGARVLIAGVDTPLSPWIEPDFLKHEFGAHEWTVVTPLERPASQLPSIHLAHAGDVQPAAFDHAFLYDDAGNLRREYDHAGLVAAAREQPEAIVIPDLEPWVERLRGAPNDDLALLKAGEICLRWGLDQRAEDYLRRSIESSHERNPYGYFFLGQLKERQRDRVAALADYQHAVDTDQTPRNALFQQAVERIRNQGR